MGRAGAATHPHLQCHRGPSACMYTIKTFVFNQLDFFIQLIALVRWGCGWERESHRLWSRSSGTGDQQPAGTEGGPGTSLGYFFV